MTLMRLGLIRHAALAFALALSGCADDVTYVPPASSAQTATDIDPQRASPDYWLGLEAKASVRNDDFEGLWSASRRAARDLLFEIDREDRRAGVMTTEPMVSAQFFEPWRRELQTTDDLADASVATLRRSIVYEFGRAGDAWVVAPKVLVERQAIQERRVSGTLQRTYFRRERGQFGTRETDTGAFIPDAYWYPTGRDEGLERHLAERITAQLQER